MKFASLVMLIETYLCNFQTQCRCCRYHARFARLKMQFTFRMRQKMSYRRCCRVAHSKCPMCTSQNVIWDNFEFRALSAKKCLKPTLVEYHAFFFLFIKVSLTINLILENFICQPFYIFPFSTL